MTLREELENGVLSRVAPDEPIFVLRANDVIAPALVQTWAVLASSKGTPDRKIAEARTCQRAMLDWQKRNGCKVAD